MPLQDKHLRVFSFYPIIFRIRSNLFEKGDTPLYNEDMEGIFMKPLLGIHHVTAMTSSAERIYEFFTFILGLRLVKKTVNQDDIQTYHLFFADDRGSAGTDMTFFEFKGQSKAIRGSNEISKTGFRVPNDDALEYFQKRFAHYQVDAEPIQTLFGKKILPFKDFDDQEYVLISDQHNTGVHAGIPWQNGPVPNEYAIYGLGPIFFRINNLTWINQVLTERLTFKQTQTEGRFTLYETGLGGNGGSVIVEFTPDLPQARQGFGGVHHVAFGVEDTKDIQAWISNLNQQQIMHSGLVDRFYFRSLYTRMYPGILFEFATEGPGFIDDEEPYETLGELLALPPKYRHLRNDITKMVRHIDTKRSDKTFKKEYTF